MERWLLVFRWECGRRCVGLEVVLKVRDDMSGERRCGVSGERRCVRWEAVCDVYGWEVVCEVGR